MLTPSRNKRIFLAGPMTGREDYNYPAFFDAAKQLREMGFEVINPAENFGGNQNLPYGVYLRETICQVTTCDGLALLPGWTQSNGAKIEVRIAQCLEMPIQAVENILGQTK
jgi:hypothetical protein